MFVMPAEGAEEVEEGSTLQGLELTVNHRTFPPAFLATASKLALAKLGLETFEGEEVAPNAGGLGYLRSALRRLLCGDRGSGWGRRPFIGRDAVRVAHVPLDAVIDMELRMRRRVPAFGAPRVRFAGAEVPPALVLDVAEYDVRSDARRAGFFVHEVLLSEASGREVVTPRTCT